MSLHAEEIFAALLRLEHLQITLVFRRMDDRGAEDDALAQRQPALVQVDVGHLQDPRSQSVLLQQVAETHDRLAFRDAALGQ